MVSAAKSRSTHYETLGLATTASDAEIQNAFAARVGEHIKQPKVADAPMRRRARQLNAAYEALRDPVARQAYDASLALELESGPQHHSDMNAENSGDAQVAFVLAGQDGRGGQSSTEPGQMSDVPDRRARGNSPPEARAALFGAAPCEALGGGAENALLRPARRMTRGRPKAASDQVAAPIALGAPPVRVEDEAGDASFGETANLPRQPQVQAEWSSDPDFRQEDLHDSPLDDTVPYTGEARGKMKWVALGVGALVIALGSIALLIAQQRGHPDRTTRTPAAALAGPSARPALRSSGISEGAAPNDLAVNGSAPSPAQKTQPVANRPMALVKLAPARGLLATAMRSTTVQPSAGSGAVEAQRSAPGKNADNVNSGDAALVTGAAANPGSSPAARVPTAAPPQAADTQFPQPVNAGAPATFVSGGLVNSDNPRGQFQGTVGVRFTVQPNGQVTDCRPVSSSGNPQLDVRTCQLVEQRLVFRPALNSRGRATATEVRTTYAWGRKRR